MRRSKPARLGPLRRSKAQARKLLGVEAGIVAGAIERAIHVGESAGMKPEAVVSALLAKAWES